MNVKVCLRNGMFDRISVGGPRGLLKHALPALGRAQYVVANPPWGAVDSPATRSARRGRNVSSRLTGADGRTARPPGGKIAGPRSAHDRPASREGPRKSGSPRGDHRRDAAGTRRLTGGLCGGTRTLFICGRERRGGGAVVSARSRLEGDHGRGRSRPLVRGDRRVAARPGARGAGREEAPAGYAPLFLDPRRYLEGHYDAQRFPFFGIRSRPGSSGTNNAPVVTHVRPWAEAAGIRVGDQILAVDGDPVPPSPLSFAPLYPLVHRYVAGGRVTLRLKREEKTLDASLRLLDWREAADATGADVGPPPGFENN